MPYGENTCRGVIGGRNEGFRHFGSSCCVLTSPPALTIILTTSTWPLKAAPCRGVARPPPRVFTREGSCASNSRTVFASPFREAMRISGTSSSSP